MIENMPEKTGKSLEEWKILLEERRFEKHGEAVKYLKDEHGVSHGFANTIVALSRQQETTEEDLVAMQFQGKESLLPIYKKLIATLDAFGSDVQIVPKKTTVSIIRHRQFALIKPASKTRIDLGLKFDNKAIEGRLLDSGPFGTMCTHRVPLSSPAEVDSELTGWLREAYEQARKK